MNRSHIGFLVLPNIGFTIQSDPLPYIPVVFLSSLTLSHMLPAMTSLCISQYMHCFLTRLNLLGSNVEASYNRGMLTLLQKRWLSIKGE